MIIVKNRIRTAVCMIHRVVFLLLVTVSFQDPDKIWMNNTQSVKEHSSYREILILQFYGNFFHAWPPIYTHIHARYYRGKEKENAQARSRLKSRRFSPYGRRKAVAVTFFDPNTLSRVSLTHYFHFATEFETRRRIWWSRNEFTGTRRLFDNKKEVKDDHQKRKRKKSNRRTSSDVRAGRSGSRLMEFARVPSCGVAGRSADLGYSRFYSVFITSATCISLVMRESSLPLVGFLIEIRIKYKTCTYNFSYKEIIIKKNVMFYTEYSCSSTPW